MDQKNKKNASSIQTTTGLCSHWDMFAQQTAQGTEVDVREHTATVLLYNNTPYHKLWMNADVQKALLFILTKSSLLPHAS